MLGPAVPSGCATPNPLQKVGSLQFRQVTARLPLRDILRESFSIFTGADLIPSG